MADQKVFPNGFTSWQETHYEVVSYIQHSIRNNVEGEVERIYSSQGTGGLYDLAEKWTNEFELKYQGKEWDGEFLDTLEEFCQQKENN